jgi:hypothetical protein
MLRKGMMLAMGLAATLIVGACGDDDDDGTSPTQETFTASLTPAAERPDPVTGSTGTGTATVSFTGSGGITYNVSANSLTSTATMAHIHGPADASAAAQIIAPLTISATGTGMTATGTITTTAVSTISLDSLKALLRNGKAYVNVHTTTNPNGEVRGQLVKQN